MRFGSSVKVCSRPKQPESQQRCSIRANGITSGKTCAMSIGAGSVVCTGWIIRITPPLLIVFGDWPQDSSGTGIEEDPHAGHGW